MKRPALALLVALLVGIAVGIAIAVALPDSTFRLDRCQRQHVEPGPLPGWTDLAKERVRCR